MLSSLRRFACLLALILPLKAADLTGTVHDTTGTPIPGVTVSLGAKQVSTDVGGTFVFKDVAPGRYEIKVEHPAFRPATVQVAVSAEAVPAPLSVTLELAEVKNEVTVSAEGPQVDTGPADNVSAVTIDSGELENLPVLGTDYMSALTEMVGGAGADPEGATVVVDGVEMDASSLPAEAIQQVRINRDPYTAEFSRPGRGRIEITTRNAASAYHGSLRVGVRNSLMDARNAFATDRPDERRNLFAGYLSGPLDRSGRTSIMAAGEREDNRLQSLVYAQTPQGLVNQQVAAPGLTDHWMVKVRRMVGDKHTFDFRFRRGSDTADNQGVGGFRLPEAGYNQASSNEEWRLHHAAFLSPNLISDLSMDYQVQRSRTASVSGDTRQISVADAFVGGGAQLNLRQAEKEVGLKYVLSWQKGRHLLRGGLTAPDWNWQTYEDLSQRQGAYQFASLADYQAGRPFAFTQQLGNGLVRYRKRTVGFFLQDTFNVRPGLTLGLGARYDVQNFVQDDDNLAPRVSIAYAPGKSQKTVIRAGFGIFYDRVNTGMIRDALLYGGSDLSRLIISNPSYPDPFLDGASQTVVPPALVRLADGIRSPYLLHTTVAVERKLTARVTASATYTGFRGISRYRSRDVNAPLPLTLLRPDPAYGIIRQIESSGLLTSNSLELGVSGRFNRFFTGSVRYELGRVMSNADGYDTLPANSYNIGSEWSPSSRDRRHVVRAIGTVHVMSLFDLGVRFLAGTGQPYTLITGNDDNQDGIASDRPAGVARNSLRGPGWVQLNLRFSKEVRLPGAKREGPKMVFTADAFNIFNHVNYASYVGNLSSPFFGQAVSARPARRMQLGLRFSF